MENKEGFAVGVIKETKYATGHVRCPERGREGGGGEGGR